ncbi:hypothetical protein EON66_00215 [archaeon]|nr:MAG: hypothetical protein EON66_00215 [archaeon]
MAGLVTIYSRAFVGRALFARVAARSAAASSAWFAPTSALAASAHHLTVASSVRCPGAMRVASFSTKKKGGDAHADAAPAVAAPLDAGDLKTQMAKHVDAAKKELAKLRGATASACT